MNSADVPMFDLPAAKPLPRPVTKLEGVGPIKYAPYRAKAPVRCADCLQVALEANRAGQGAPLSRQARFTRKQGSVVLRLCIEHKQSRETVELHQAVLDELRAHGGPS